MLTADFTIPVMGIKGLNSFLNSMQNNPGNMTLHLSVFKGKTIVVDFTNQLHRFLYRDTTEKYYLMEFINFIHKFQRYDIKLMFVFDGKPSVEKQYIIEHRKAYRERLIKKIDELTDNNDVDEEQSNIIRQMTKKATTVKNAYILECKKLFDLLGIPYIHVDNLEADVIFKYLLDTKKADACFTADTDVLAYGCHTVLKELNYRNDTVQCIYINRILEELGITHEQLVYTCILSGTDYNNSLKRSKFEINLELVRKYGTIQAIIDNLDEINASQPEEYKKSLPMRFDWRMAYSMFMNLIPSETQKKITETLSFQEDKTCSTKKTISLQLQQYMNNSIKPFDKGYKYIYKLIEIVRTKFNIELKLT